MFTDKMGLIKNILIIVGVLLLIFFILQYLQGKGIINLNIEDNGGGYSMNTVVSCVTVEAYGEMAGLSRQNAYNVECDFRCQRVNKISMGGGCVNEYLNCKCR